MWDFKQGTTLVYRRTEDILSFDISLTHLSRILIFGKYKLSTPTLLYALIPSGIDEEAPKGVSLFLIKFENSSLFFCRYML